VAINVLNGPGFVFVWNSAINYANRMAPQGMAGTAQGLLVSIMNLAGVVSSLLSGWLFDLLGPTGLFVVMGFVVLAALILFSSGYLMRRPGVGVKAASRSE
jgi:predicted MFS family arabinose efflux permease